MLIFRKILRTYLMDGHLFELKWGVSVLFLGIILLTGDNYAWYLIPSKVKLLTITS